MASIHAIEYVHLHKRQIGVFHASLYSAELKLTTLSCHCVQKTCGGRSHGSTCLVPYPFFCWTYLIFFISRVSSGKAPRPWMDYSCFQSSPCRSVFSLVHRMPSVYLLTCGVGLGSLILSFSFTRYSSHFDSGCTAH